MRSSILTIAAIIAAVPAFAFQQDVCAGSRDLHLTNGRIVTMDRRTPSYPR